MLDQLKSKTDEKPLRYTDTAGTTLLVSNIHAGYLPEHDVLKGVSIRASAGSVTTLIGPNGCGKSTLLKTMSKLVVPRSGEVSINGDSIHALRIREAARLIAMLPQHPIAPDGILVGELVARGRHPHQGWMRGQSAQDREEIAKACEATGISDLVDRKVSSLSGGQRQRVWLAMALAQDTPVLLLDEPTTFLDPAHALEMLELAREQAKKGKAVVMVLHDLMLAGMYSDTLVVMKQGQIVAQGSPQEALTPEVLAEAYGLDAEVWNDPRGSSPVIVPRGVL